MSEKLPNANVALCYVRQSVTRDDNDTNSPDRQRANIGAMCEAKGWIAEWYEDTGGHKSGRSEKGRPQWLALKKRLNDPDVVALVANDLSRLHRKGWRVGDLIETLNNLDVALTLASPSRQQIDTSTQQGRMLVQLGAMFDEYYAEDVAQRAKDSVQYRKAQGITIGRPPFGTLRNEEGQLIPSNEGAWLLSDGTFVAGFEENPPDRDAVWRGYYELAKRILEIYSSGNIGMVKLSYAVNDEGWAYRNRKGKPRRINRDDIRRVIANWAEYGGLVRDGKAICRPAYEALEADKIVFDEDRAVFDIDLLREVVRVRHERTLKPKRNKINRNTHFYPLTEITYCAHCERLAYEKNDPSLRSVFGGASSNNTLRYKHKRGVVCKGKNRSVRCEIYEHDFFRLLQLLEVKPEAIELMSQLAYTSKSNVDTSVEDVEAKKKEAIAVAKRRLEASKFLFLEGDISKEEYIQRKENDQREIAHWKAFTTEQQKLALELSMCVEAISRISNLWQSASPEDRQGLVRNLFEYLVYDLDTRKIVDFRLKAWADKFVILRANLYEGVVRKLDTSEEVIDNSLPNSHIKASGSICSIRDSNSCFRLERAMS